VLKDIIARFDGKLALNAEVLVPGTIRVGDPVGLVRSTRLADSPYESRPVGSARPNTVRTIDESG
jgi:hypothetical protein